MSNPDYADLVEPPTARLWRPGRDVEYCWVNSDAIKAIHGFLDEPRDELTHPVDEYVAVSCPICEWSKALWGFRSWGEMRMDYDHHISTRHRGSKTAYVTVEGKPNHGIDKRAAGKHFRRNVETDKVELLNFSLENEDFRPGYTATFTVGKWRGNISNKKLSKTLADKIDFEAFENVDVEWEHSTPRKPASVQEQIEAEVEE